MKLPLPDTVLFLIECLNHYGFTCFAVGGCIRDLLRGEYPNDFDLTTDALPEEIKACFLEYEVLETGIRHGTVTVLIEQTPYEITTYRTESIYSDHRHPDEVHFTRSLLEDLKRRDFTINAMAYHPTRGLVDLFGGAEDLKQRRLRAVGDADQRFQEDALRILRGLRFASTLQLEIDSATANAMQNSKSLLLSVSAERIWAELGKLLTGCDIARILLEYSDILAQILPELLPMIGFSQNHPFHHLDVYEHTAAAVSATQPILVLRLTMLLHDSGKPHCCTEDAQGIHHFYGHAAISAEIAEGLLRRLKVDRMTIETVVLLITHHGDVIENTDRQVKRCLNRYGEGRFRLLLAVQRADTLAQAIVIQKERIEHLNALAARLERIVTEQDCFSLRQLAVDGNDLIKLGLAGCQIGIALQFALQSVIEERVANDRESLLLLIRENIDKSPKNRYDKEEIL